MPFMARRATRGVGETFMLFGFPTGVVGNVINAGTNELILPNYKRHRTVNSGQGN